MSGPKIWHSLPKQHSHIPAETYTRRSSLYGSSRCRHIPRLLDTLPEISYPLDWCSVNVYTSSYLVDLVYLIALLIDIPIASVYETHLSPPTRCQSAEKSPTMKCCLASCVVAPPTPCHFDRLRDRTSIRFTSPHVILERANETREFFRACCGFGLFDGPTDHRRATRRRWSPA